MEWDEDRIHDGPGVGTADSASARTRQARAGPGLRKSRSAQRDPGPGADAGPTGEGRARDGARRVPGRSEPMRAGPGRPGPACAMRAQRDAVRLTSRRASPARHNPPELDSREPTWRNASPGDITEMTPPGAGLSGTHRVGRGPRRPSRRLPQRRGSDGRRSRHGRGRSDLPRRTAARARRAHRSRPRRREAVALLREQHHYSASDTARALGVSRQRVYQLAR